MPSTPTILLLPGLDGTGRLFGRLVSALGARVKTRVISYPTDRFLHYPELVELVVEQAPTDPHVILAESFSGPIAALVASRRPSALRGVVLSASFVAPPAPQCLRTVPFGVFFRFGFSPRLLRWFLLESSSSDELVVELTAATRSVSPAILAARLREVLGTDASEALRSCDVPVVQIAGAKDKLLGSRGLRAVQRARPGTELVIVNGPHLLLQARPQECAAILLARVEGWCAS